MIKSFKSPAQKSIFVFFSAVTIIINLTAFSNVSFSQGRRDWDNTVYEPYDPNDTTTYIFYEGMEISFIDTTYVQEVDSTARIRLFVYEPDYNPGIILNEKQHPLILGKSSLIQESVTFDSNNVIIRQTFMGEDIKAPLIISFDEYIERLSERKVTTVFNEIVTEKFTGYTRDELTELFERFTDITIPLPFKTETIFGPPTINLRITGAIDITASYENVSREQTVTSLTSNTQNNINFKQEVLVTAKGKVGDKLSIDADWNTQRIFDFENQLKIRYDGYADEVIKSLEAGNVSLQTNSGLIQSTQALFGIKGEFQLGPLTLSTVVSQKKSKLETKDYAGGILDQQFSINIFNYSDNHYFFDPIYKSSFNDYFFNNTGDPNTLSQSTIDRRIETGESDLEVWIQTDPSEASRKFAVAHIELEPRPPGGYDSTYRNIDSIITGVKVSGLFRKLSPSEYFVYDYAGFISLKVNVPESYNVAVSYRTNSTGTDQRFGDYEREFSGINDTLVLKLIKAGNVNPGTTPLAWEHKLKNIYRLPVSRVIRDDFELNVMFNENGNYRPNIPNDIPKPLNEILDLDRYVNPGFNPPADGVFDFLPGYTINIETGDIIFPTLKPFLDNFIREGVDSLYHFKELYDNPKIVAQNSPNANRFVIQGKAKGEAGISNVINLGFNVVQGSVKVLIGTQELQNNVDYTVDYSTGTVVIKSASALLSKDLKIQYETNELFSLASKTLLGARGDYKINETTSLGFTFLNLKQETFNQKVRIGEEPTNNTMLGLDFRTEIKPKLLTNLVNLLPGYNTKEESAVTLRGEFAYMLPNPNTLRSRIPQDNNEPVAYVDDMEGSKKIVSMGTNYSSWYLASAPLDSILGSTPREIVDKRGRFFWYNIANDVAIKDIFPERDVQPGQDRLTPLYLQFNPHKRGTYNYAGTYNVGTGIFNDSVPRQKIWGGMMKYLNTTTTDLINDNINFIEFNMRIETNNMNAIRDGKLVVDLGLITEDIIPNLDLDSEDPQQTGVLISTNDIGLDFKTDEEEKDFYNQLHNTNFAVSDFERGDPGLDNNDPSGSLVNQGIYDLINGTQGNALYEGGNRPDTEDLNRNGNLDRNNEYFQYEISLDTTDNQYISGVGRPGSGWFQYRIPISEFVAKYGSAATLSLVEYARVWIAGVEDSLRISIVDFNLVGNQWYKTDRNDTTYTIGIVSIEENPQIYRSPVPGNILRQEIQHTTGVNTLSNESSLALNVTNLVNGERKLAIKDFRFQALDLFNYKILKLFVNGDPMFNYTDENLYDATMIVRLGTDSSNFYEYRAPIRPDVRPGQPWNPMNEVTINFSDLTSLKILQDTTGQVIDFPVPEGPPGSYYRIRGNPALTSIREIALGIEKNRNSVNATISGSVWFNEIRVLNIEDETGYAFNINTGVKFADLLNLNFNFSKTTPNFFPIESRFGTRRTGQNWDVSGTLNLHRFINNALSSVLSEEWSNFLNIPLTFRHSETLVKPKFFPGTDIDLERSSQEIFNKVFDETGNEELARIESEKIKIEAQTLEIRNELGIQGMQFNFPSNNYLVKNVFNKLLFNLSATFGNSRDVVYERKDNFDVRGGVDFSSDFGLADILNLPIGRLINLGDEYKEAKLYFALPFIPLAPLFSKNFVANTNFNRARDEKKQRRFDFSDPTSRQFNASRGFGFEWKFIENWIVDLTGNYNFKVGSDLTPFETTRDSLALQRPFSEVFGDIFLNDGLINFGKDLDYVQTTTFNPRFNIPVFKKFVDLNMSYNVSYGWRNPNANTNIGYNVGYSNNFTSSANLKLVEIFNLFKPEDAPSRISASKSDDRSEQSLFDVLKLVSSFVPKNINMTFNQTNTVSNPGVIGRPGFGNFWLEFSPNPDFGPSRLYQLGLSQFPGERVPNVIITDIFNIQNDLSFTSTINPIFESVRMNLTFKNRWGFDNLQTYNTGDEGQILNITNKTSNRLSSNSMFFASNIEDFRFEPTGVSSEDIVNITSAFKGDVASFPFPNWTMTITGVEKFPFFGQFASAVTLENSFISEFSERIQVDRNSNEIPGVVSVRQSFTPLFGINMTFKETFGGNLTAALRINTTKENRLDPANSLVKSTNNSDWNLSVNFSKAGFELPLFGLSLKNDISFSLTVSKSVTNPIDYRFLPGSGRPEALEGTGSTITILNPSIQYSLSQRVQMQLFFKNVKTEPTSQNVNIVPNTTNEGGLNIRIAIQ